LAFALFLDHLLVDLSGRYVVVAVQSDVEESLVVSQVQVDFTAIVEHINLA
jgi:hypothetical protein